MPLIMLRLKLVYIGRHGAGCCSPRPETAAVRAAKTRASLRGLHGLYMDGDKQPEVTVRLLSLSLY